MKLLDIIFALICGEASAFLINDLISDLVGNNFFGAKTLRFVFLFLIPILSILFLWTADLIAKKFLFVLQLAKHILVGLLVVLVDLEIFTLLSGLSSTQFSWFSGTAKAISFLVSVSTIKFFGNKYWAFDLSASATPARMTRVSASGGPKALQAGLPAKLQPLQAGEKEKNNIGKQFTVFLMVTLIGLIIDVSSFLCLIKIIAPQLGLTSRVWVKISVIIAAIIAAAWNFLTYKFIVFKKQNASTLPKI